MNKRHIKITVYIVSVLVIIIGVFITADYFALFGSKTNVKLDFSEVRFRTIDAETGGLVMEVGVRCFQQNNNNACTRRESGRAGVVSVHIPLRRVLKESLFFKQSEEIIKTADPKIHIMLLHKDYHNPVKTLLLDDVYANKINEYQIDMPPREWESQQDNMEEKTDE